MKKLILFSFLVVSLGSAGFLAKKYLRIEFMKQAKGQSAKMDRLAVTAPFAKKDKLDAPTDMPIPKELLNELPPMKNLAPATAKTPQIAPLPPPALNEDIPPMESLQAKSPQDLDPSMKFLNNDGFVYDPTGRRDPFHSFIVVSKQELPTQDFAQQNQSQSKSLIPSFLLRPGDQGLGDTLEGNDVSVFKLIGILWDVNDPKAMLRSPSNKVFMVRRKTRIGRNNGYVAAIREGEIVVVELTNDAKTPTTRVLSLQK